MEAPQHIAIVGGGITGLAAAHAISEANRRHGYGVRCTLLESGSRLGGKVQTELSDGFLVEQGPDAMLARKADGRQFCEQLGLGGDLVGSHSAGGTYVVHRGRLQPLPESMVLVAPTRLRPWLTTPLLSPLGKLRAGLDLVLPARTDGADETLEGFVRRRFGGQVADRLAVPLLAAVYGGGSGDLSLQATFPDLGALERQHRSLLLGLRAMSRRRQAAGAPAAGTNAPQQGGASSSVFVSLRGGMHSMVTSALQSAAGVRVLQETPVSRIEVGQRHGRCTYRLSVAGGTLEADGVILATPAYATQQLVEGFAPAAAAALAGIDYLPTVVVVVAFPKERIANPLHGTGFLVPESEGRRLIACTWLSRKWPHVSPADTMLLRCYVGGAGELADEDLYALVCDELRDLIGAEGAPIFRRVYRWSKAMPRYALGHLDRVRRVETALREFPGLAVAGAAYHGVGVPDCIRQGRLAAESLLPRAAEAPVVTPPALHAAPVGR